MIIGYIFRKFKLLMAKSKWRKTNSHNFTRINHIIDQSIVTIGNYTYGTINISCSNNMNKVYIGNFCSIADNVTFIINNDHPYNMLTTYPLKKRLFSGENESISKGDIIVEDDVWIGNNVLIMSGVKIGQGSIVAAGSVVTKDVAPYSIVGGCPAKQIKKRFPEDVISRMINIDYSKIDKSFVEDNIQRFYQDVTQETKLDWLPQKEYSQ